MKIKQRLENTKKILQQPEIILTHLIIIIAALGIFFSPLVVDYDTLPKGYELPKVFFWQVMCLMIIALSILNWSFKVIRYKKISIGIDFLILIIILLLLIISAILSPFKEIALIGNDFRFQGLFTYALMIIASFCIYKNINKKNWHFVAIAFVFSGVNQTIYSYGQYKTIIGNNPDDILSGIWINGTFGQANWFSGRLLMSIIFAGFYLGLRIPTKKVLRILFKLVFAGAISLMIVAIAFSQSMWAIVTLPMAVILMILYELFSARIYSWMLRIGLVIGTIASVVLFERYSEYNLRVDIWQNIYNIMFQQEINANQVKAVLFGYGFDTLGEVFTKFGRFPGSLIDRAHNFILDILVQNGVIVLGIFTAIICRLNFNLKQNLSSKIYGYTLIALIIWMFRSIIHESGIVNLMDFMIILAMTLGLRSKAKKE